MMTRKELLGNLMSKGVVVTNPLFENEDLEHIDAEVTDILETIATDEYDEDDEDEIEVDVPVAEQELVGKRSETTDVVHVLYPGEDFYPDLMTWAARMKKEYDSVDLKYFDELDAFVFFSGKEDEAESIAEELINDIE